MISTRWSGTQNVKHVNMIEYEASLT